MIRNKAIKTALLSSAIVLANSSQAASKTEFNIPRTTLSDALHLYVQQSGDTLTFSDDLLKGLEVDGLEGKLKSKDALKALLSGSGFIVKRAPNGEATLVQESRSVSVKPEASVPYDQRPEGPLVDDSDVEEVMVTGSRLVADPTLTTRSIEVIGREQIEQSGVANFTELMRRMPQNLNGASSTGSGVGGAGSQNLGLGANVYGGTSVNLRGLGAQYTLILIDGRRPAKGGLFGDVTNIGNIPMERIERVEILYDGAAAIYGSDAVGGVVNIITRKDFEGTQFSLNYNVPKDDGGEGYTFNLGHTFNLDNGTLTFSSGYSKTEGILTSQRDYDLTGVVRHPLPVQRPGVIGAQRDEALMLVRDLNNDGDYDDPNERLTGGLTIADPAGGPDVRLSRLHGAQGYAQYALANDLLGADTQAAAEAFLAQNIDGYSPVYYANLPTYASGQPLSLYDIALPANVAGRQAQFDALGPSLYPDSGQTLSPGSEQYNLGTNFQYDLLDNLRLSVNADWSRQEQSSLLRPPGSNETVRSGSLSNPFGVDMDYVVDYGLPQEENLTTSDSLTTSASFEWDINEDWLVQFNSAFSRSISKAEFVHQLYGARENASLNAATISREELERQFVGTINSRLNGSGAVTWRNEDGDQNDVTIVHEGIYFHDPLLGFSSVDQMYSSLVNPFYSTRTETSNKEFEVYVQGRLFTLPGGDVTTNMIVSRRQEDVDVNNSNETMTIDNVLPGVQLRSFDQQFEAEIDSLGGELSIPVIGQKNALPWVKNLSFHTGFRAEEVNYFDEGVRNWSVGLNYQPADWATLRVNLAHSNSLPSPQLTLGGVEFDWVDRGYLCPTPACQAAPPTDFPSRVWAVRGAADNLSPETTDDLVVDLELRPWKGWRLGAKYTDKAVRQQLGTPGSSLGTVTHEAFGPASRGEDAFLRPVTADTHVYGIPFTDYLVVRDQGEELYRPAVGDYLMDQRTFNIRRNNVETLDLSVNWSSEATDYGQFFLTWLHTRMLSSDVLQNSVCSIAEGNCGILNAERDFDPTAPVSIVGEVDRRDFPTGAGYQPLPQDTGSIQLNWGYKGWSAGVGTVYQSATVVRNEERFNGPLDPVTDRFESITSEFYIKSTPALGLNVNLGYDFGLSDVRGPNWLKNTRVNLAINDLFRRDEKFETTWIGPEPEESRNAELNSSALRPRGTTVNLRINTTF